MKGTMIDFKKMLAYSLVILSCLAFGCDDDDDDDNIVQFNNIQLRGSNEVPAVTTNGMGTLNATYNRDTNILNYTVTWNFGNSSDNLTGMHFHGPALPTANAPVVIDITPPTTNRGAQGTVSGTTRALTEAEESELLSGRWYINVHSTTNPTGELRGQL